MSKPGRAPFGSRRRKKAELEDVPVITGQNVEAETRRTTEPTEALHGSVTPDKDSKDIVHEFQRLPVKTIYADEPGHHNPFSTVPQPFRRPPTEEKTVIEGYNTQPEPEKPRPHTDTQPTVQRLTNVTTGKPTLTAALNAPPPNPDKKKTIRGK